MKQISYYAVLDIIKYELKKYWAKLQYKYGITDELIVDYTSAVLEGRSKDLNVVFKSSNVSVTDNDVQNLISQAAVFNSYISEISRGEQMLTCNGSYYDENNKFHVKFKVYVKNQTIYDVFDDSGCDLRFTLKYLKQSLLHEAGHCIVNHRYLENFDIKNINDFMAAMTPRNNKYAEEIKLFDEWCNSNEGNGDLREFTERYYNITDEREANEAVGITIDDICELDKEMEERQNLRKIDVPTEFENTIESIRKDRDNNEED